MTLQEFERRVQNAKDLDFGDIFNKSMELFKKVWVQGLVMLLLTMLILMPFYFIMYLPLIGAGMIDPYMFEPDQEMNFVLMVPFFLFGLLFGVVASVVSLGMKAGFYRICKMKDLNEAGSDDYFYFFKKQYIGKLVKLSLAIFGISFIAALLCYLPIFYVIVPITLMNVIFAFNPEQSISEIIKSGFALGNKKWLITFGLVIVCGILASLVGMIMCFIGVFVTASFAYIPTYYIYKESIGFDEEDEIAQIGNL